MGDIANKEQAEKCRDMAKDFMRRGEFGKASKFFAKSLRMYNLPGNATQPLAYLLHETLYRQQRSHVSRFIIFPGVGVAELLKKADEMEKRGQAQPQANAGPSPQAARPSGSSPSGGSAGTGTGSDRPYTAEQEEGAALVVKLSQKCYYQVWRYSWSVFFNYC